MIYLLHTLWKSNTAIPEDLPSYKPPLVDVQACQASSAAPAPSNAPQAAQLSPRCDDWGDGTGKLINLYVTHISK
jgi:hypothetical protein